MTAQHLQLSLTIPIVKQSKKLSLTIQVVKQFTNANITHQLCHSWPPNFAIVTHNSNCQTIYQCKFKSPAFSQLTTQLCNCPSQFQLSNNLPMQIQIPKWIQTILLIQYITRILKISQIIFEPFSTCCLIDKMMRSNIPTWITPSTQKKQMPQ